jgi:hypothetical protein
LSAVLCAEILSLTLGGSPQDLCVHFIIPYTIPLIAAVFFFRWPGQGPVEAERLAEAG